ARRPPPVRLAAKECRNDDAPEQDGRERRQRPRQVRVAAAPAPGPLAPPYRPRPHRLACQEALQLLRQGLGTAVALTGVLAQALAANGVQVRRPPRGPGARPR